MAQTDEHLLELAIGGDQASFAELVRRWQEKIFGFICRNVGNREEARDLTQDTFSKVYQNLDRLGDPSRFSSWLYKIALNECRMQYRRQSRVRQISLDDSVEAAQVSIDTPSPEGSYALEERAAILRSTFADIPAEQREVIMMKEYQGLKFHEIAEVLDIPVSTVKSRMYLGLKTLRRLLERRHDLRPLP